MERHPVHKKLVPLIPKGSLPEQVKEEMEEHWLPRFTWKTTAKTELGR